MVGTPVKSPCVSACRLFQELSGICEGCGRTLYEIKMWTGFSNDVKLEVREQAERRKSKMKIEKNKE